MNNLYVETVDFSNITAHIRIYKGYDTAEVYFYRNSNRFMYHVWVYVRNDYWQSFRIYRDKDDIKVAKKYPQYIDDIIVAVGDVVRAYKSNEISMY